MTYELDPFADLLFVLLSGLPASSLNDVRGPTLALTWGSLNGP